MELIRQVIIPNYIEHVKLSNKRKPIYYKKGDSLPNRYKTKRYAFDVFDFLIDTLNGDTRVIKNSRTAFKPRMIKIAGQDFWSGINPFIRTTIANQMKLFFYEHIREMTPIREDEYPIAIEMDFYDNKTDGDLDNLEYIYRKTLHDALCGNIEFVKNEAGVFKPNHEKFPPKIVDDSKTFLRGLITWWHVVPEDEKKIIIKIHKI